MINFFKNLFKMASPKTIKAQSVMALVDLGFLVESIASSKTSNLPVVQEFYTKRIDTCIGRLERVCDNLLNDKESILEVPEGLNEYFPQLEKGKKISNLALVGLIRSLMSSGVMTPESEGDYGEYYVALAGAIDPAFCDEYMEGFAD